MPLLDRDQRGPVAAMSFIALFGFAWTSLMAWYIGEVAVGDRKLCNGGECPDSGPAGIVYGRIGVWTLLAIAIGVAAYFGRGWILGERGWRGVAIASGVGVVLAIAFVVMALLYPLTYVPPEAEIDF